MVLYDMPIKSRAAACRQRAGSANLVSAGAIVCAFAVGTASLYFLVHRYPVPGDSILSLSQSSSSNRSAVAPPLIGHPALVRRADFRGTRASVAARRIADWVVDSADNQGMPFVIVDKVNARILAFDASGRLTGAAAALLGITRGDDSAPGIGEKALSAMTLAEKTTPAGRFVAELGHDLRGEDVVWLDYDAGLSLHRVLRTNPAERREQRLDTPTVADNRISFGCINVPVSFYEQVIRPAFLHGRGIVYVLPELKSVREVFGAYDVEERGLPRSGRSAPLNDRAG